MTYQPDDADTVLADFGEPVAVLDGLSTTGMTMTRLEVVAHFGVDLEDREIMLSVKPGTLGAVETDQKVTVAGKGYRYRGLFPGPQDLFERHRLVEERERIR